MKNYNLINLINYILYDTNSCPHCRKKFPKHRPKPRYAVVRAIDHVARNTYEIFAPNYNIFRIMSGMGGLQYTS